MRSRKSAIVLYSRRADLNGQYAVRLSVVPHVTTPSANLKYGIMLIYSLDVGNFHTLFPKILSLTCIIAMV